MIREHQVWSIFYQLANALAYCHQGVQPFADIKCDPGKSWEAVLHRDIKAANGNPEICNNIILLK